MFFSFSVRWNADYSGVGSLISDEGFTMLMSPGGAVSVWKTLLPDGAVPMGSEAWEKLRVIQGCTMLSFMSFPFFTKAEKFICFSDPKALMFCRKTSN